MVMKNEIASVLMIAFIAFLLTGCEVSPLTEKDNGSTVEYSIDSQFEVQLKGNPQAGFRWKTVGLDKSVLEEIGEPVIKTYSEDGRRDATYTFTFKTRSAGHTLLRLIYYNKNNEDPKPEDVFEIHVISGMMGRIES
jgi:predicted secreted protein